MSSATLEEIRTMLHMLGANTRRPGFRNYGAWSPDDKRLQAMVEKGLVTMGEGPPGGLAYYRVTESWKEVLLRPALGQHEKVEELTAILNCGWCAHHLCPDHEPNQ